jgi:hypothetical protein
VVFNKDNIDKNADKVARDLEIAMHEGSFTEVIKELSNSTQTGLNNPQSIQEFTSRLDQDIQSNAYLQGFSFAAGTEIVDDVKAKQSELNGILVSSKDLPQTEVFESTKEEIVIDDTIAAVNKMFPLRTDLEKGDAYASELDKHNAAFRIILDDYDDARHANDCSIEDLNNLASNEPTKNDLKILSSDELAKVRDYEKQYKPSVDEGTVDLMVYEEQRPIWKKIIDAL